MSSEIKNNFLRSLQNLKGVPPEKLHMNIFTKRLSSTPTPFTTNDVKKIGTACGKALDELNEIEGTTRKFFLDDHYATLDTLIKHVDSKIEQKVDRIKQNHFLNSIGLAEKAGEMYKKWKAPHIVPPDLPVS